MDALRFLHRYVNSLRDDIEFVLQNLDQENLDADFLAMFENLRISVGSIGVQITEHEQRLASIETSTATTIIKKAAQALDGHRVVSLNPAGEAEYPDDYALAVGLTLQAAGAGEDVTIVTGGIVTEGPWTWTPGGALFLAADGMMTQDTPAGGKMLKVGYAVGSAEIMIRIQPQAVLSSSGADDSGDLAALNALGKLDASLLPIGAGTPLPAASGAVEATMDGSIKTLSPTGDCTLDASGGTEGQSCTFVVTTEGTTPWEIVFGANFKSAGSISTGAESGKMFSVSFVYDGTNWCEISRTTAM